MIRRGAALVFSMFIAASSAMAAPQKRVLFLYQAWATHAILAKAMQSGLSGREIIVYDFPIIPLASEAATRSLSQYIGKTFPDGSLDLIVLFGFESVKLFARWQSSFPSTPVIIAGDESQISPGRIANEVLVLERVDFSAMMENILHVLPATRNVAVIIGHTEGEIHWRQRIEGAFQAFGRRVTFTWVSGSMTETINQTMSMPPNSAIFFHSLRLDGSGEENPDDILAFLRLRHANAPMFSWNDGHLGNGIVGGPLISMTDGRQLSAIAMRVLNGEHIRRTYADSAPPKYDWQQISRWGIDESRLLPGRIIVNRAPSAWEEYRWQILLALIAQCLLIALYLEVQRRRMAETRAGINRIATLGIAHEIRQPLTGIALRATTILDHLSGERRTRGSPPPGPLGQQREIGTMAHEIIAGVHAAGNIVKMGEAMSAGDLAPVNMNAIIADELDLLRSDLNVVRVVKIFADLPAVIGNRMQLQEAVYSLMVNAIEAMDDTAEKILTITTTLQNRKIVISISDTGHGVPLHDIGRIFEPSFTTKGPGRGVGLSLCRTIIETHGGHISATQVASPNQGLEIRIVLPVQSSRAQWRGIFHT